MPDKIDPDVLHEVAKQVVGLPLESGDLIARAIQLLAEEYALTEQWVFCDRTADAD